jgi:hypothetical protein
MTILIYWVRRVQSLIITDLWLRMKIIHWGRWNFPPTLILKIWSLNQLLSCLINLRISTNYGTWSWSWDLVLSWLKNLFFVRFMVFMLIFIFFECTRTSFRWWLIPHLIKDWSSTAWYPTHTCRWMVVRPCFTGTSLRFSTTS